MAYAIRNKRNGKFVKGTDHRFSPPRQRLTRTAPRLYEERAAAVLDMGLRKCGKDYEVVEVVVEWVM